MKSTSSCIRRLAILGLIPVMLGTASAASAASYGPRSDKFKGNKVVIFKGSYSILGKKAINKICVKDPLNDGNTVYGKTVFDWAWDNLPLVSRTKVKTFSTPEHSDGRYRCFTHKMTSPFGTKVGKLSVTIHTYACAQMGFPVRDQCTKRFKRTFKF